MRTIYEAKNYVMNKYGRNVNIRVNGIRNKCENISCKITEIYKNIFLVKTDSFNRCFSYKDLLLGIIKFVDK